VTIFGKKDFQQLVTIKTMIRDLNMDIEVVGMPTTREQDGLAMSSRNVYLSAEERKSALCLSRSLAMAKRLFEAGETEAAKILDQVCGYIRSHAYTAIDYVKISDVDTVEEVRTAGRHAFIAMAVRIGKTRLIDNYVFGEDLNISYSEER